MTLYYVLVRKVNDVIIGVSDKSDHPYDMVVGGVVREKEMGSSPAYGGMLTVEGDYTPPAQQVNPVVKLTWSGDGSLNNDTYEMAPDGVKQAVLTLQKWDMISDIAINTGGESYWVSISGITAQPSAGKVVLDGVGSASVSFVPATGELGLGMIDIRQADESSPLPIGPMKLGLS